jgi:amino acid transporter
MATSTQAHPRRRVARIAIILGLGAPIVALLAVLGASAGAWSFLVGFAVLPVAAVLALVGAVLAVIALVRARRRGDKAGRWSLVALVVAVLFVAFLGSQFAKSRGAPFIHDATTDLTDIPQFEALTVRADNLKNVPDQGRPELARLDPESRWKAIHREAYGDLRTLRLPDPPAQVLERAEALARERGWTIARVDPGAGTVEATATTLFFRFKDDVVVRVRPDPAAPGASLVDMRSISRIGGSDLGTNARRIRDFLKDLAAG